MIATVRGEGLILSEANKLTPQIFFQAEPEMIKSILHTRTMMHDLCKKHMHRKVRVETVDGIAYEGTIIHIDHCLLYLHCGEPAWNVERTFANPYSAILPLVLYELLVITLLYT